METNLQIIGEDIWLVDGDCVNFNGFPYPTRSIIVRLETGELWYWSPIKFNTDLKSQIDALGPVRHLVSPNKLHHLFLKEWKDAYPNATLWGPNSTIKKRKDLDFGPPLKNDAPSAWHDEIEQIWVRGSFAMDEMVFFHHKSRTLIMADLSEHFSEAFLKRYWTFFQRQLARLAGIVEGKGYAPLDWRLSFYSYRSLRKAKARFLELDPINVVMAHGDWRRGNGSAFIEQAFQWV